MGTSSLPAVFRELPFAARQSHGTVNITPELLTKRGYYTLSRLSRAAPVTASMSVCPKEGQEQEWYRRASSVS